MLNYLKKFLASKPAIVKTDIPRRFELMARIGQGTMSEVWHARDGQTEKVVVLKVLDKAKTGRHEARFANLNKPSEGEIAVSFDHPNIVKTFEHGITTDGEQFLVMEYVEGVGLSVLIDSQNEQMVQHRLNFMIQLGEAIEYVHKQGWICRDLCPPNVLVDATGVVKLIDFGLAVPNTAAFRKPGNRTGKANYMAPELIKRQATDERIDIFSYAVTCFEMWTRQLPWEGSQSLETVQKHLNQPPIDIRTLATGIDEEVASTIMKGLARDPRDRWQNMSEMLERFRHAQEQRPTSSPNPNAKKKRLPKK